MSAIPTNWGWVTNHAKATGKTTSLIAATKAINGILVCLNQRQADHLAREHGIRTMSMNSDSPRGLREPFLFEPEVVGILCGQYESRIASLMQENAEMGTMLRRTMAEREIASRLAEARLDCRGGPGATQPACGACVTCLHRDLEAYEKAIVIARSHGDCSPFCRMPPREIMKLSSKDPEYVAWKAERREHWPEGPPCDCWKSAMNAELPRK